MDKHRVLYIDIVKGFCIIWVVWFHTLHPRFVDAYYHVPLFFFISGFYLTDKPDFIAKRFRRLIVPHIKYFIAMYPFWILLHFWDYRTISNFNWDAILYLFRVSDDRFIAWNGPLWFLPILFILSMTSYYINKSKHKAYVNWTIIATLFCFYTQLKGWGALRYFIYLSYFLLGYQIRNIFVLPPPSVYNNFTITATTPIDAMLLCRASYTSGY